MASGSLRFFLRDRTQAAHASLDRTVGSLTTLERYRSFVVASYAHRSAVEAFLQDAAWPAPCGDWRPAVLAPMIAADLVDLDLPRPEVHSFATSNDIASLIGVAYVVEGSALGARLIWKMAGELGLDATHGARHLASQHGSLANWRGLLAVMDSLEGLDRQAAADAANATFAQAMRSMKDNGFA